MRLIAKAWRYYWDHGFVQLAYRVQHRKTFVVVRKQLEGDRVAADYPDIHLRIAYLEDIPLVVDLHRRYQGCQAPRDLVERICAGELTILGTSPGDPSDVLYVSVASRNHAFFRLLPSEYLDADDLCSQGIWVPRGSRARGVARRGLSFAESAAYRAGARRLWAFVKSNNKPSLALHRTRGYEQCALFRVGRHFARRFAGIQFAGQHWQALAVEEPESLT